MFDEQPRNDSGSGTEGETGDKAGTGTVKDAGSNAGAPTGATIAATAKAPRRKAKRARKGPKLPLPLGLAKIVFALLTAATVLVAAWFAGFHLMVATVAPHAPVRPDPIATSQTPQSAPSPAMSSHGVSSPRASSALAASNPADYPATAGHVTLRDLALFAAPAGHPEMRNADTPTYRAYAAAKAYYDWYLEWYNVLAVGFLTSIAAYFVGEAVNAAMTTRLKDAPGKAPAAGHPTSVASEADTTAASTPSQGPDGALTVHNFLGILSISLGAIAALGVFIVNEHYRLLEPVHGDLPLRLLGAGPIAQDRWLTEPNVMRGLYDAAVGGAGRHAGYFPALYTALALTCLLPLMAGGSAIEAFRLTAALMGKVPGKAAQIVRDLLEGLKAQHARATADLEALNGRALSETEALRPLAAELQKCLADEADALRTQEVKIERLKRCRDFATTLSEYLEDLALKRRHLLDKRGDAHGPDARPAEPIDQNLESAVEALDLCLEQVKAAHLSVLREIARLEDELRAHALSLTACRERIAQLHPQVMALEARLAAIRTETERLEGRLGGLVEDIARQDEIVRDLSHPGSATNGVVVETWRGNKRLSPQQVDGRRATLTVRFYALLVLAGLLFLLGNLVTSPNLPDTSRLAALGKEGLTVSVLNWDFATLNLLIVAVWVALGLSMTWLTQRFFATKGASGWLRIASLVAATCLGVSLVGAVTSLPPGLRPQTPSLPDSLGLARLSCTTGPGRPDGVKPDSAFLFAAGQTLTLDATTQCRGESDPSEVNFYLVVGTASFEGEAAINEDLGNARALALMDTLAGDAATPSRDDHSNDHRRLPAAPASRSTEVYALNLGAYDPDPTVPIDQRAMTAWAAASVSRNADERLSRTLDAMAASAYQRKIVVLQGYSHHGGSASREEISAALGEWLCRGAKLDEGAFQTLTGLDARKYQVPVQCLGGRIALMSRQDVRDEIALATARREAREAKALTQALEASRPPHHRVRLILNGRKADAAPPAITAPGE